ncbi:predicted protein [Streptomyces sp. SPB78]|nr:predicted protein [Streptomyces sp. SPB78]
MKSVGSGSPHSSSYRHGGRGEEERQPAAATGKRVRGEVTRRALPLVPVQYERRPEQSARWVHRAPLRTRT